MIFDEGQIGSEESEPSFFSGIFAAGLLDSDYLNEQSYLGSMSDYYDETPSRKQKSNAEDFVVRTQGPSEMYTYLKDSTGAPETP